MLLKTAKPKVGTVAKKENAQASTHTIEEELSKFGLGFRRMTELVRRFFTWLFSESRASSETYGNPDLHPIDVGRVAKQLDIENQAKLLGSKGIPRTEDTAPTGLESKIVQVIEKARQEYSDWGTQRARLLNATISKTDINPQALTALQLDAEFERKAGGLIDEGGARLGPLKSEIDLLADEYREFQKNHGLSRAPRLRSPSHRVFLHLVLVALIFIEGALNSVFFAQGMWGGIAEGFFYAGLFAALNVLLAYFYGTVVLPQSFHHNFARKLLGFSLLAVSLAGIVALALLIAHYRDAVTAGKLDTAAQFAWTSYKSNPIDLKDAKSVLLCIISIAFALVAMVDALFLDDPYPGYGRVRQRLNDAIDDYHTEMATVREPLEELKADSLQELDSLLDKARIAVHQLDQAIALKEETAQKIDNAFLNADNCLTALIDQFRTHNAMHRETRAPDYFSRKVKPRTVTRADFSVQADRQKLAQQQARLKQIEDEVPRMRANIQSSYSKLFDRLKPLEEHFSVVRPQSQ